MTHGYPRPKKKFVTLSKTFFSLNHLFKTSAVVFWARPNNKLFYHGSYKCPLFHILKNPKS